MEEETQGKQTDSRASEQFFLDRNTEIKTDAKPINVANLEEQGRK